MFKKLIALLTGKPATPKFITTYDLAKYAIDQIDRDMKALFAEKGRISLDEAKEIGNRAQALDGRLVVSVNLAPGSVFLARHKVAVVGTRQGWDTDNFIDKYKNPNI